MKKWIFCLVLLVGCTKNQVICDLETVAVNALTPAIATTLQCSNSSAISASLTGWMNTAGFCSQSKMGMGKDKFDPTVCSIITSIILSASSGNIPSEWGCTAANAQLLLGAAISQACLKL